MSKKLRIRYASSRFGRTFLELRRHRRLSRAAVVRRLSDTRQAISPTTLRRIEAGELVPPIDVTWALLTLYDALSQLERLLDALEFDTRDIAAAPAADILSRRAQASP